MKFKTTIFLSVMVMISANVFGQKPEAKPAAKTTETKSTPSSVKLPAAKEILDRYVQAIGGRAAHEKIKTRVLKGTIELAPMGVKGTEEVYQSAPDKIYTKLDLNGIGETNVGYDGKTAWMTDPIQGMRDITGDQLTQMKLTYNLQREINLDRLYPKMEVKGIEKVGDREAYVVVATPAGLDPETFYFDVKNGLLLRYDAVTISPAGKMPTKTFYEDMREVDGVKLPFKIRAVLPQFELVTVVSEIKHGVAIEDSLFSKPK